MKFELEQGEAEQAGDHPCRLPTGRYRAVQEPQHHHHGLQEDRGRQDRTLQTVVHQKGNGLVAEAEAHQQPGQRCRQRLDPGRLEQPEVTQSQHGDLEQECEPLGDPAQQEWCMEMACPHNPTPERAEVLIGGLPPTLHQAADRSRLLEGGLDEGLEVAGGIARILEGSWPQGKQEAEAEAGQDRHRPVDARTVLGRFRPIPAPQLDQEQHHQQRHHSLQQHREQGFPDRQAQRQQERHEQGGTHPSGEEAAGVCQRHGVQHHQPQQQQVDRCRGQGEDRAGGG